MAALTHGSHVSWAFSFMAAMSLGKTLHFAPPPTFRLEFSTLNRLKIRKVEVRSVKLWMCSVKFKITSEIPHIGHANMPLHCLKVKFERGRFKVIQFLQKLDNFSHKFAR